MGQRYSLESEQDLLDEEREARISARNVSRSLGESPASLLHFAKCVLASVTMASMKGRGRGHGWKGNAASSSNNQASVETPMVLAHVMGQAMGVALKDTMEEQRRISKVQTDMIVNGQAQILNAIANLKGQQDQ